MATNYYTGGDGSQQVNNYLLPNGTYYSGPVSGIPTAPTRDVSTAFSSPPPTGLTPAQLTAYQGVQTAFAPTTTRDANIGSSPVPTSTTGTTRSVALTPPTPPTYQAPTFNSSPVNTGSNDQSYTQFNTALMGLLKTQQGLGTRGFQEQGFNAQQAQNNKVLAPTDPNLIGASPGLQNSVRSGQEQAIQPLVTQAGNAAQTFGEQIRSVGDAISAAKSFGDSYQNHQDNMKQQAQSTITQAMNIGGAAALQAVQKANPDIFKTAGLDFDSLLAAAQAQEKYQQDTTTYNQQLDAYKLNQPTEVQPGNSLVDNTGNVLYSNSTTPSSGVATTLAGVLGGKTYTSGSLQFTPAQYHQFNDLLTSRTQTDAQGNPNQGADGYTNPQVYLDALTAFNQAGGSTADFLKLYPVNTYINKANTWPAIIALGGGTKPSTSTSTRSA